MAAVIWCHFMIIDWIWTFEELVCLFAGSDLANRSWHFCGYNYRHRDHSRNCSFYDALVALTVTLLLDALLVFGISIWAIATNSSAIKKSRGCACCCQCCIESPSQTQSPIVIYLPANQVCRMFSGLFFLCFSSSILSIHKHQPYTIHP